MRCIKEGADYLISTIISNSRYSRYAFYVSTPTCRITKLPWGVNEGDKLRASEGAILVETRRSQTKTGVVTTPVLVWLPGTDSNRRLSG